MKNKKMLLFVITITMMLTLISSKVYAIMAPISRRYLLLASIIRLIFFGILLIYIIFCIVYLVKSKKSKTEKVKKIIFWLVIVVIISLILWYGTDFILANARKW